MVGKIHSVPSPWVRLTWPSLGTRILESNIGRDGFEEPSPAHPKNARTTSNKRAARNNDKGFIFYASFLFETRAWLTLNQLFHFLPKKAKSEH